MPSSYRCSTCGKWFPLELPIDGREPGWLDFAHEIQIAAPRWIRPFIVRWSEGVGSRIHDGLKKWRCEKYHGKDS